MDIRRNYDDLLRGLDFVTDLGGSATGLLGILGSLFGQGRREADILVQYQNQLGRLLEQVNAEMRDPSMTIERLQMLREVLVTAMTAYERVLAQPWKDGRAAAQGRETMFGNPGYARVTLENLDKLIAEKGGSFLTGGGATAPAGNALLLAGVGLGAFLLLKK